VARKVARKEDLRTRLAELSGWRTATRDDVLVAEELHESRAMDRIYPLSEAAFFDEFFRYIDEIGARPLLDGLDPKDREGPLYPFIQFVLMTIMRCVGGVESMLATRDVLLTDEALMGLLGFNAAQVQQGSNDRGLSRRTKPVEVRGALSFETVADNIVKVGPEKLSAMFNGAIRCLAKQRVFPKHIDASLDATDDEATPTYTTDAGGDVPSVTREKRPDVRANKHTRKVKVTVFGWKIWIVFEPVSKIPLAMKIDGINVADNEHAYEVLAQARANVEGYATVRSVALDRGFLDGKLLSRIEDDAKVIIYIPAKSNMTITADAREIGRRTEELAAKGKRLDGATYKERVERVTHGSGKKAWVEERKTTVVRILRPTLRLVDAAGLDLGGELEALSAEAGQRNGGAAMGRCPEGRGKGSRHPGHRPVDRRLRGVRRLRRSQPDREHVQPRGEGKLVPRAPPEAQRGRDASPCLLRVHLHGARHGLPASSAAGRAGREPWRGDRHRPVSPAARGQKPRQGDRLLRRAIRDLQELRGLPAGRHPRARARVDG